MHERLSKRRTLAQASRTKDEGRSGQCCLVGNAHLTGEIMGFTAVASCTCGYESPELLIGCGDSCDRECLFPAYCTEGGHLVTVNLFDKPLQCPSGHQAE